MADEDINAKPIYEPVGVKFGYEKDVVFLLIVGIESGKTHWHLKLTPETARECAQSLTMASIKAEDMEKSSGG